MSHGYSMSATNPLGVRKPGSLPRHWRKAGYKPTPKEILKVHFDIDIGQKERELEALERHAKALRKDNPVREEELQKAEGIRKEIMGHVSMANEYMQTI